MTKDRRYTIVKNLISSGHIKSFNDIFDIIPRSVIARDLGMNYMRFTKLMNNLDLFVIKDVFQLAVFLEIDEMILLNLIYQQYKAGKKIRK